MTLHLRGPRTTTSTDPAHQAFLVLPTVLTAAPVAFGLDKFANS